MEISTFLNPELIKLDCRSQTAEELFKEVLDALFENGYIRDKDLILTKLIEREQMGTTTAIGHNSAIPHAKIKDLEKTIVFLAISKTGVVFDKTSKFPEAKLIVFIFSPKDSPVEHVNTLAAAVSLIRNNEKLLKKASKLSPIEIIEYIKEIENGND